MAVSKRPHHSKRVRGRRETLTRAAPASGTRTERAVRTIRAGAPTHPSRLLDAVERWRRVATALPPPSRAPVGRRRPDGALAARIALPDRVAQRVLEPAGPEDHLETIASGVEMQLGSTRPLASRLDRST